MSDQILFDKLAYMDRLKRAGIAEDHARAHTEAIEEALRASVAIKNDIVALKADMQTIKPDLQRDLLALEHRLTAAVVAILASIKYFG